MRIKGGELMEWKIMLTSVVTSAVITAIFSLIKSNIDNQSKRNDALTLFRYTKLYEIMVELQKKNQDITEEDSLHVEFARNQNLVKGFTLARPLVDEKLWGNISDLFNEVTNLKIKMFENATEQEKLCEYVKLLIITNGQAEICLENAIHRQMVLLLKVGNK